MPEGVGSLPDHTVATTDALLTVSPIAREEVKSNTKDFVSPDSLGGKSAFI
jgi:hypothetical protein